jgi:glycerol-3-phosphate acyltransferase PlsY
MEAVGFVVFGYLLGSCPWGYWLVRAFKGTDIRREGSGNIGGSNV